MKANTRAARGWPLLLLLGPVNVSSVCVCVCGVVLFHSSCSSLSVQFGQKA